MRLGTLLISCMLLVGCAAVFTKPTDPGPLPANYKELIIAEFNWRLKDPGSAIYVWGTPAESWCGPVWDQHYGWLLLYRRT